MAPILKAKVLKIVDKIFETCPPDKKIVERMVKTKFVDGVSPDLAVELNEFLNTVYISILYMQFEIEALRREKNELINILEGE